MSDDHTKHPDESEAGSTRAPLAVDPTHDSHTDTVHNGRMPSGDRNVDDAGDDTRTPHTDDSEINRRAIRGFAKCSVVTGIVAVILCFLPTVPLLFAALVGIAGTVLGLIGCLSAIANHDAQCRTRAAVGTLVSACALLLSLLL